MTRVYIDTNIFVGDFHMKGMAFSLLFDSLPKLDCSLHIPHVVFMEVSGKYREVANNLVQDASKISQKAEKHFGQSIVSVVDHKQVHQLCLAYTKRLKEKLQSAGAVIVNIPQIDHFEIVSRDIAGKKPFKANGAGYRDYLIWCTIIESVKWNKLDNVVLITRNTKDFIENGCLCSELVQDLEELNFPPNLITVYDSLEKFNEVCVVPALSSLQEFESLVRSEQFITNIIGWLITDAKNAIFDDDVSELCIGIESTCCHSHLSSIAAVTSLTVNEIKIMHSGDFLVQITAQMDLNISVSCDYEQYCKSKDVRSYFGELEEEEFSIYMDREDSCNAKVIFHLIIDKDKMTIKGSDEDFFEGPNGSAEINPYSKNNIWFVDLKNYSMSKNIAKTLF